MQQCFPTHSETVIKRSYFHKIRIVTVSRDSALNQRCWIYLPMIHSLSMFAPLLVHWWSERGVLLPILNTRARIKKTELLNYSHLTLQHIKKLCASTREHGTLQKIFCEFAQGFPRYQCLRDSIKDSDMLSGFLEVTLALLELQQRNIDHRGSAVPFEPCSTAPLGFKFWSTLCTQYLT